jgi:hypothetical protein
LQRGYNSLHIELVGMPPTVPGEIPAGKTVGDVNEMSELAGAFDSVTAKPEQAAAAPVSPQATNPPVKETETDITNRIIAAADTAPVPPVRRRGRPRKEESRAHAEAVIGEAPQPMPENGQPDGQTDKAAQSEADHKAETAERARRTLAGVTEPVGTTDGIPARRGRGRPPGVKNKPVAEPTAEETPANGQTIDTTDAQAAPVPARKRGRPPGAKNKKTAEVEALSASLAARPAENKPAAGPDVGSWSIFLPEATKAASAQGIAGGRFNEGINRTLINARLMAVSQDRIPREFLLDFYDAIVEGRWNVEEGSFTAAKPQMAMAAG